MALNAALQTAVFRHTLEEGTVTAFLPSYTDSEDYMNRANGLANGDGFEEVFCDGSRVPGYPLFLSIFVRLFEQPAPAVRVAQILISSSVILISAFLLLSVTGSGAAALAGAALFAIWLPFYYFSPVLYAESLSIGLFGFLLLVLARFDPGRPARSMVLPSILAVALVYLKPNHILLLPAVAVLPAGMSAVKGVRPGARLFITLILIAVVLLAPWTVFVSKCQRTPVLLTTYAGYNLYIGSGGGHQFERPIYQGSLSTRAWKYLDLRCDEDLRNAYAAVPPEMRGKADKLIRREAVERWKKRPLALSLFGMSKVLHTFGFSMRGVRDFIVILHFLGSLAFSILLWRRRRWREWSLFLWSVTFITAAQAFVFLGEMRFKTVLFDLPAVVVSVLGIIVLIQRPGQRTMTTFLTRSVPPADNLRK